MTERPNRNLYQKIDPAQVRSAEEIFRHVVVTLKPNENIATFAEGTDRWDLVQRHLRLRRGDRVSLVSNDGLILHDQCVVLKAEAGRIWLSRPLRVIELEPDTLFQSNGLEVVPNGVGYSIRHTRNGSVEREIFASADAAKNALLKRQPVRAA